MRLGLVGLVAVALALAFAPSALAATYTSTITIQAPPASQYAGSGGGDGWSLAFSTTQVFNVFHHQSVLQFACHNQSDASACYSPETITDTGGNEFATSGHPDMYFDNHSGKLYVYATRSSDSTAGVVCIDTTVAATNTNPFCGYTALTPSGDGPTDYSGISGLSNPQLIGSHWYAYNYVEGAGESGAQNTLLCFDVSTDAACSGQPFTVPLGLTASNTDSVPGFPTPAISAIAGDLIIPMSTSQNGDVLGCFSDSSHGNCGAAYPVSISGLGYIGGSGAPVPLLSSSGTILGYCLPTGTDQCFTLAGASTTTPANMPSVIQASDEWNGPAVIKGTRIYVPSGVQGPGNGGNGDVECFDFSASGGGAGCANFPFSPQNLGYLYTVTQDPQRPSCLWVNADNGSQQIQNFDAFSGQPGCGSPGKITVDASQFIVNQSKCYPASYNSIQVNSPAPSTYSGGNVSFLDQDGNPIGNPPSVNLDNTGTANLNGVTGLNSNGLPQFIVTLNSPNPAPTQLTITLTYQDTYDPSCTQTGTTVTPTATTTTTSLSGGGKSGASISVPPGTAVSDQASLSGTNAAAASGSVTYSVYSNSTCTALVGTADKKTITTNGSPPASSPVTLNTPGTYYWVASYSGDAGNKSSSSSCGSEVETVSSSGPPPAGCTMNSTTNNTQFDSNVNHIENALGSNTSGPERLVLRSLTGPAHYFSLGGVTSATCQDNPSYPLAAGHSYNEITVNGTGLYGTDYSHDGPGYSIHIEIQILGAGSSRVAFQITKTSTGATVWSVPGSSGGVSQGSETETG